MSTSIPPRLRRAARALLLPLAALAGSVALSGCYYGPYPYYGAYGYPAYAYAAPAPVVGGVYLRGGYGYRYWR